MLLRNNDDKISAFVLCFHLDTLYKLDTVASLRFNHILSCITATHSSSSDTPSNHKHPGGNNNAKKRQPAFSARIAKNTASSTIAQNVYHSPSGRWTSKNSLNLIVVGRDGGCLIRSIFEYMIHQLTRHTNNSVGMFSSFSFLCTLTFS